MILASSVPISQCVLAFRVLFRIASQLKHKLGVFVSDAAHKSNTSKNALVKVTLILVAFYLSFKD